MEGVGQPTAGADGGRHCRARTAQGREVHARAARQRSPARFRRAGVNSLLETSPNIMSTAPALAREALRAGAAAIRTANRAGPRTWLPEVRGAPRAPNPDGGWVKRPALLALADSLTEAETRQVPALPGRIRL